MPQRAPGYSSGRLASLDGLRACSIVLVLLGHLAGARHFLSFETINRVGDLGNLGVRVFFVISGFLITGLLAAERSKTGRVDLTAFYIRRALRIFPAFLVFLAGAVILSRAGFAWLDRRDFLQAVTYTFNYRGPTPNFSLRHLWSLAVEEQFYLIWPLTFASLAVANGRRALGAVLMVVPILRVAIPMVVPGYIDYIPTAFESVCDALATGCLAALLLPELRRSAWVQRIIFSRLFPLAIALVWVANRQSDHPKFFWMICIPLMNVLIALLMIRYVERPSLPFGRFLNTRPMVAIGTLSYSLYLWQQLFLIQFRAPVSVLQAFPGNVIAALACAAASYRFVETPFLRLKTRFEVNKKSRASVEARLPESGTVVPVFTAEASGQP